MSNVSVVDSVVVEDFFHRLLERPQKPGGDLSAQTRYRARHVSAWFAAYADFSWIFFLADGSGLRLSPGDSTRSAAGALVVLLTTVTMRVSSASQDFRADLRLDRAFTPSITPLRAAICPTSYKSTI